jgi:hypothetical protein
MGLALMLVQSDSDGSAALAAFGLGFSLFFLAISIVMIAAIWGVFSKAGQPGWAAIIPIYNVIVWLKVAGKPWWWILLFLIPFVNIVMAFIVAIAIAQNFGKGAGFGIGLALLGFIFYPILAWSDATYQA